MGLGLGLPIHLDMSDEAEMLRKVDDESVAMAWRTGAAGRMHGVAGWMPRQGLGAAGRMHGVARGGGAWGCRRGCVRLQAVRVGGDGLGDERLARAGRPEEQQALGGAARSREDVGPHERPHGDLAHLARRRLRLRLRLRLRARARVRARVRVRVRVRARPPRRRSGAAARPRRGGRRS